MSFKPSKSVQIYTQHLVRYRTCKILLIIGIIVLYNTEEFVNYAYEEA